MTRRLCRETTWHQSDNWSTLVLCTRHQGHTGHHATDAYLTPCDATAVYWPDAEAVDVHCHLPAGHDEPHEDHDGDWLD